jgi:ankyrin repeat protein
VSKTKSGSVQKFSRRILATGLAALAAGMMVSSPAYADYSEGYKFLESVKKKEGEKVEKALMDNSQIVNAKDVTTGETGLHIVTQRRDLTWLGYLIGKGANVNASDDHGRTPLQLAVSLGWRDGVQQLLDAKAQPDPSNDAGETPLIFAVHRKDADMVKVLLQAGANPDRADNSGRSARDYAAVEAGKNSQLAQTIEQFGVKGGKAKAVYGPVM